MIVTVQVRLLKDYEDHSGRPLTAGSLIRVPPGEAAFLAFSYMAVLIEDTTEEHEDRRAQPRGAPRATGGPVTAAGIYFVGENGPEIIVPGGQ